MEDLSEYETRRQAHIVWTIRKRQNWEFGESGVAARVIAADAPVNATQSKEPLGEGELVYPFRRRIEGSIDDVLDPLLQKSPDMYRALSNALTTRQLAPYLVGLGRYCILPGGRIGQDIYYAGLQIHAASPTKASFLQPIEPIEYEDVDFIADRLHQVSAFIMSANLTCLNDNLLNEQIHTPIGLPLP